MNGSRLSKPNGPMDEKIALWGGRLERGIKRREDEEPAWDLFEDFENLYQWKGKKGQGDEVTVNKLGSYITNHRAAVAYKNPRAKMTPSTAAGWTPVTVPELGPDGTPKTDEMGRVMTRDVIPAKARESLFNAIVGKPMFGLTDTISRLDKAAILGYGMLICGYRPIFSTAPDQDGEQMLGLNPDGSLDTSEYALNPATGVPIEDERTGRLIRKDSLPVWEEWFIDWISYRDVIIDPDGENDFKRHRWVAFEEWRTIGDVKADHLFKNTKDLVGTAEYGDGRKKERKGRSAWADDDMDKDDMRVRLFHIFDIIKDEYLVMADGHGKFLRDGPKPRGITQHPMSVLRYQERQKEFYPRPKAADLVPICQWYNESRRLELVGAGHSLRKPIVRKGVFDDENLLKLTNGKDMEVVFAEGNSTYPIDQAIGMFAPPPVNPSVYRASASAAMDFDEIAGSPETRGRASSDSATESNNLRAGEDARNEFDRVLMRNCILENFKKLNDSIDANMSMERAVELTDTEGQTFMALVDNDMIAGDVDIDIDVREMAPSDTAQMAANRVQLLQMAGSFPHQFSDELRTRGWCELFGIYDENFIKSIVEGAQAQIQAMMAEAQAKRPEAGPPGDEGDAVSQSGAGSQIPSMQGAT